MGVGVNNRPAHPSQPGQPACVPIQGGEEGIDQPAGSGEVGLLRDQLRGVTVQLRLEVAAGAAHSEAAMVAREELRAAREELEKERR